MRGKGTKRGKGLIVLVRDYYVHEGLLRSGLLRSGMLRSGQLRSAQKSVSKFTPK